MNTQKEIDILRESIEKEVIKGDLPCLFFKPKLTEVESISKDTFVKMLSMPYFKIPYIITAGATKPISRTYIPLEI